MNATELAPGLQGLSELRAETQGHPDIVVAVLDGRADLSHPCFRGARLRELPTLVSRKPEDTGSRHGTHVASILFGQPESPVPGLAPGVTGLLLPLFSESVDGSLLACSQVDVARAIDQAVEAGAHVINISAGELTEQGETGELLKRSVEQAARRGRLVVSATGNEGCQCLHVPAALPQTLAVGALDPQGLPAPSSNWSPSLAEHGIMAPGVGVLGALPGGEVARLSGTSFAAPIVSGVAALLLSLQREHGAPIDPLEIGRLLLAAASPCRPGSDLDCVRLLGGRLDIRAAWRAIHERLAHPAGARPSSRTQTPEGLPPAGSGPISNHDQGKEKTMSSGEMQGIQPQGSEQVSPQELIAMEAAPASGVSASEAATEVPPAPAGGTSRGVRPSCGCDEGTAGSQGQMVFTLGTLYYDFGTEARRDYFIAQMGSQDPWKVYDPSKMAEFLGFGAANDAKTTSYSQHLLGPRSSDSSHPEDANALIWTLNTDQIPMYAIRPDDQYAFVSYLQLVQFLYEQEFEGVERIAIAGTLRGTTRLLNGTVVPVISPVTRGMFSWSTPALTDAIDAGRPANQKMTDAEKADLETFLQRIYYELRNLGVTAPDRARNFAATNGFQASEVFKDAYPQGLKLDKIAVEKSPICRPESDCWDVSLLFFDPTNVFSKARQIYRYTIDVSDVVPVQVGTMRSWQVYSDPLGQ